MRYAQPEAVIGGGDGGGGEEGRWVKESTGKCRDILLQGAGSRRGKRYNGVTIGSLDVGMLAWVLSLGIIRRDIDTWGRGARGGCGG